MLMRVNSCGEGARLRRAWFCVVNRLMYRSVMSAILFSKLLRNVSFCAMEGPTSSSKVTPPAIKLSGSDGGRKKFDSGCVENVKVVVPVVVVVVAVLEPFVLGT